MKSFYYSCLFFFLISSVPIQAQVWQREAPDTSGMYTGYNCSLTLDDSDNPHIAYYFDDYADLYYAYFSDGRWIVEVVDSIGDTGRECSLTLDAEGRPHISYRQEYNGIYWKLKYAVKTDSGWVKEIVDTPVDSVYYVSGYHSSIAIDESGSPVIAFQRLYPDEIRLARKDDSGWHVTKVADVYAPGQTKLVLDRDDNPVIGFTFLDISDTVYQDKFRMATFNVGSETWSFVDVPERVTIHSNLTGFDLDTSGRAFFSYLKWGTDTLRLAVWDGNNWTLETVTGDAGQYSSPGLTMTVDHVGHPAVVAFFYSEELRYYTAADGRWKYDVANNYKEHTGLQWDVSLAFDSHNNPRIAVHGSLGGKTGLFYYRYWPGQPHVVVPEEMHDYGTVWTESYADWYCTLENSGEAPLIVDDHAFYAPWYSRYFSLAGDALPLTIMPGERDSLKVRFAPAEEATVEDTLYIITHDTAHTKVKIVLRGEGASSGTSGTLQVDVNNVYIDHEHQSIRHDRPLAGAAIELYRDGHRQYGPVTTDALGRAVITEVDTGMYDLKIVKEIRIPDDEPGTYRTDLSGLSAEIRTGPGVNTLTFYFPDSLLTEKYQDIYDLTHITRNKGEDVYTFHYPAETDVRALLDTWKGDLPPETEASLSRLILAEDLVYQMFDGGYSLGSEFLNGTGELINLVYYSDSWGVAMWRWAFDLLDAIITHDVQPLLKDMLIEVLKEFLQSMIMNQVTDVIHQMTAELGQPGEVIFNAAWETVRSNYSGWSIGDFSGTNWEKTIREVYRELRDPLFQFVYIDQLTDDKIGKAADYSGDFQYGGTFKDACDNSIDFTARNLNDIENTVSACQDLRVLADLFMATGSVFSILDQLSSFVPGMEFVEVIRMAMKIGAYGSVVTAMGISGYSFFTLPGDLDHAMEDIYLRDHPKSGRLKQINYPFQRAGIIPDVVSKLKENLEDNTTAYDSILFSIKENIQAGNQEGVLMKLHDLIIAEGDLRTAFNTASAPAMSVASLAKDSISGFVTEYDSLRNVYAKAGEERLINYISVLFSPFDTSQAMKDTLSVLTDRASAMNHAVAGQIVTVMDKMSGMDIPAIVTVNLSKQDKQGLESGETATLQIQVQNAGSMTAQEVSIVLKCNEAIGVAGNDSIYVGSLAPGQKSQMITFTVSPLGSGYSRGIWNAEIHSSNAKTYATGGSFAMNTESTGTGKVLQTQPVMAFAYPNPFDPSAGPVTLHYSIKTSSEVTIKIYDTNGKLVRVLLNKVPKTSNADHQINWNGNNSLDEPVPDGMYLYLIETSRHERGSGRIVLLH